MALARYQSSTLQVFSFWHTFQHNLGQASGDFPILGKTWDKNCEVPDRQFRSFPEINAQPRSQGPLSSFRKNGGLFIKTSSNFDANFNPKQDSKKL